MIRPIVAAVVLELVSVHAHAGDLASFPVRVLSVERIWDEGGHNAFTDLVRYRGAWYCTFREAEGHVKGDGRIRVIRSDDGSDWRSVALLEEATIDLRDPKLSVTPDNRLMVVMGGSVYRDGELVGRQPRVAFSDDGKTFGAPQRVMAEGDWLWRVTWHEGTAYGVTYRSPDSAPWEVELVKSADGIEWKSVTGWALPGRANEVTLRFLDDDTMVALVRRDGEIPDALIGHASPPYTDWTWNSAGHRIGGPEFIVLPDGRMFAAGRSYPGGAKTVLARMTLDSYTPLVTLPSGGDTSYPGLVWHDGVLHMSYYASHEGKSNIYLARFELASAE